MRGFRIALLTSLVLHIGIIAALSISSEVKTDTTMRYYVDLVSMGGSPGVSKVKAIESSPKQKPPVQKEQTKSSSEVEEPASSKASLRDLTTKPEVTKSKLRFPDKKSKRKSVKRKKNRETVTVVRKKKKNSSSTGKKPVVKRKDYSQALRTGIGSIGGGEGTGSGTGVGGGTYFPYGYYIETLRNKISSAWYDPGGSNSLEAVVKFRITRNGSISELELDAGSGNNSFDMAALRAVKNAAPFPRLPSDFPSSYLAVYLKFE